MTFRAKGSTQTYNTAQQCAVSALGTPVVMLVAFDMWMSMDGRTCLIERI